MENQCTEKDNGCHSTKETVHDFEQSDPNRDYYHLFRKLHSESLLLNAQFCQLRNRQQRIEQRIQQLTNSEEKFKDYIGVQENKKKKFERRGSDQIHKLYACPISRCNRSYGSQTAFRKHLKIKHPQEYSPKKRGRVQKQGQDINDFITLNF